MKILFVSPFYNSKYYYRQNVYAGELSKIKNNRVFFLTSTDKYYPHKRNQVYKPGVYRDGRIVLIRRRPIFQFRLKMYFPYQKIINRIKPDIVHLFEATHYLSYRIAKYCLREGIPVIYEHEQRNLGLTKVGKIYSKYFVTRWLKEILHHIPIIRVATPGAKNFLLKYVDNSLKNKIILSTLSYDKKIFHFKNSLRTNFRKEYNIPKDAIVIGTTGQLMPQKKIELFIHAFSSAVLVNKKIFLFVLGTSDKYYMKLLRREIGDRKNVILKDEFLDRVSLNAFFNGIDYAIWSRPTTSYFEALGSGLRIIIPYGEGTSHLKHSNIIYYGKYGGLLADETMINDDNIIKEELIKIFINLSSYERIAAVEYEQEYIIDELYREYKDILHVT